MKWTKENPSTTGWYWVRLRADNISPYWGMVVLRWVGGGFTNGDTFYQTGHPILAEWSDQPIQEPT